MIDTGIFDKKRNEMNYCWRGDHYKTLIEILERSYPEYLVAFYWHYGQTYGTYATTKRRQYERRTGPIEKVGITQDELDIFVLSNFEFHGSGNGIANPMRISEDELKEKIERLLPKELSENET